MLQHEVKIRVRYSETDQMGYVYYGHYAQYYEVGRVECMRAIGVRYADLERKHNLIMPVTALQVRYLRPAKYDDLLTIRTTVPHMPDSSMLFLCEIFNSSGTLLNSGKVTLCFLEAETHKRVGMPEFLKEKLKASFEETEMDRNHQEE